MNIIVLFIIILFCCLVLFKPSSKILTAVMMLLFIIMITGTHDSYDYYQYTIMYSKASCGLPSNVSGTIMLSSLMRFGSLVGLEYDQFRFVVTLIESLLIQSTFKRYTENTAYTWLLFILFPGWWLTTLFRHTIALTILIWAIRYLIEDKKFNTIKYLLCVFVAGTFHSAFWFFLLLVLIKFYDEKTILLFGVASALVLFSINQISFMDSLLNLFRIEDDIAERIQGRSTSLFSLISTVIHMAPLLIDGIFAYCLYIGKFYFGTNNLNLKNERESYVQKNFTKICSTYIFSICMSLISSISSRLCHFYAIYFIIVTANTLTKYKYNLKYKLLIETMFVCGSILLTIFSCMESKSLYDLIIKAIFDTNIILNL